MVLVVSLLAKERNILSRLIDAFVAVLSRLIPITAELRRIIRANAAVVITGTRSHGTGRRPNSTDRHRGRQRTHVLVVGRRCLRDMDENGDTGTMRA